MLKKLFRCKEEQYAEVETNLTPERLKEVMSNEVKRLTPEGQSKELRERLSKRLKD